MKSYNFVKKAVLVAGVLAIPTFSAFKYSYPGCNDVTDADFKSTILVRKGVSVGVTQDATLHEPIQMDFDGVMNGNTVTAVNIYFVERAGKLKFYNGVTKTVTVIGTRLPHEKNIFF
jgi:hypothetical protein